MALVHKLLFTSFVIAAVRSNAACPVSCNCTISDLRVSVSCKGQGLTAIPTELPKNTSTVDLRDNHVKCDCQFYEYWKTLKGEGVEIHGECSDLSDKLSGLPFQELNEDSFACDGSSVSNQKTAILGAESSTAAVNAPSRSSVSGENPSMVSQKADVPLATSSVAVPVMMSSQAVPVVTSSPAVLEVKPSQAPPEVMSSQPVPEVISSHAAPMVMRSSQAADVGALSRAVPVATSSQPLHAEVKLSHAAPVLTSSQAVPVVTSSPAVLKVAPSQAVPEVISSQPVPEVTSSHAAAVVMSSQAILHMPSSRPAPVATSSQPLPSEVESSHATPVVTSSRAVPVATSSQPLPAEVESSHVAPVVTSFRAVPVATSSQPLLAEVESSHVAPVVTSSQAVLGKTSSQVVPVLTSSQALPVGTSSQAGLAITSSISAHVPDIAGLALSPSSTLAKPTLATTRSPSLFEISTSTALELADTSSSSGVTTTSSSVVTGPPMRSTGVEVNVTSVVNVSPTVSAILNGSVAAITPPTKQGSPIIVTFDAPNVVGLNTMIQVKCVATGNPPPKVYLTVNNEPANNVDGVTVTSGDAETEIEFKAVRTSEVYCEARNKLGRDKRKIRISVKQTGAKYMMLKVKLIDEEFKENMKNKDSKEFQDLAEKITSQVRSLVSSIPSFLGVSLVRLRPGSVNADILVKTFQDNGDLVEKTLKAEIDKAKLGNVPVDRYKYSFEQAQACPSEFENVTWNDAAYGEMDVQPCPRGAQGFARRNCSVGDWYYPDYTNCKSDNFVNLKNQINQSTSRDTKDDAERNILTGLQNLLNLTTPDEDHAVMAGDLAISAEILELVADYITRKNQDGAHSEREVKHVINVASNVLHLNNEQEFIVAQKLIQTASKFILVLEKYGLQAARVVSFEADKNLAIFITDNVVMGAGIANPESISKDVIFPNYNWPKLAGVQEKWNVTTFVVLGHEMIKAMKVDKSGIRIAGFLYRTLTRILSFESAYSDKGLAYEVNSAVISASMDPKPTYKLNDPVIIASRNLQEVDLDGDEPICAFWDFNMNAPHGGWSEEGCNTSSFNTMQTTCQCDHMTNFAVLRSKLLPPVKQVFVGPVRDFIHCIYIACWIIIAFAGITFLILLILSPWLEPDRTWAMHMCVCASVIVTFVLILLGLASYNNLDLCNLFSFLVHYFFLCSFSWILTESVYMRTWDTEKGPQNKYWIGYFLLGWGLPGIAMLITWLINKLSNFESYMSCWMSIFNPLIWVFFAPALIFFVVSFIFFVRIWRAITGLPRQGLKTYYKNTRFRVQIRYCLILMLMFMVTWLVGVLLITYYWKALLCILFIICCIITGFMILLFYVIMDRQVRDAFRLCCCYCRRGRKGNYWVKGGDDVFKQSPQEEIEYRQQERQRLVSEGTEQQEQDQDIEMNGVDKTHEYEEPLLRQETRLQLEEARPLESSTESFDPLYERVRRSVTVDVQPGPSTEKDERPQVEPVYAQVVKPKRLRHPESDSDDDDEFLTPEEREARGIRGLTREQVIRMAKKSDASKKVLNQYESPAGSREELGQPVYLLNQQELDEELKQFRKFFAHDKTPVSSPPATSTPRSDAGSSTPSGTFKRETSTEVTRSQHSSFSSVKGQSSVVHESYKREESTSSSITKRALSGESQLSTTSVSRREESTVEKKVGSPAMLDETAVDSSLQELDRTDDDKSDSPNKPTAV